MRERDYTDPHTFCSQLGLALGALPGQDAAWYSDGEELTVTSDSLKSDISVREAFDDVRSAPAEERPHRVQEWARRLAPPPLDVADPATAPLVACLVTVPWVRFRYHTLEGIGRAPEKGLETRDWHPPVLTAVCVDGPDRLQHVDWGLSRRIGGVYAKGLKAIAERASDGFYAIDDGLWVCRTGDGYDAARLLAPDAFRAFAVNPVAIAPRRDLLLVANSANPEAVRRMGSLALEDLRFHRRLSGTTFRLERDWQPWLPDPSHEAWPELRWLRTLDVYFSYKDQQPFWRHWYPEHEVVPCKGLILQSGERVNSFDWPERFPAVVPHTDFVGIRPPDGVRPPHVCPAVVHRAPVMERGDWLPRRRKDAPPAVEINVGGGGGGGSSSLVHVTVEALEEFVELKELGADPPRYEVTADLTPEARRALCAVGI